ncbi:hypothetical protein [Alkalicoccobacillus murimartini]|uniref:Uncharacterized protein n=1 Tax=Alkalicoccobacillus murimartini TaxID=171685 RepID=A0ABT9YJA6_9BACI|nr:hypothetical protein [Alkalicoccobacillus murimartini]MDQ0207688.1 hypothetical protein [Alkalicoccobacillus murimartini]
MITYGGMVWEQEKERRNQDGMMLDQEGFDFIKVGRGIPRA